MKKRWKDEEAKLQAELTDSKEIIESIGKLRVELRAELSKPFSGPYDKLKDAKRILFNKVHSEMLDEFYQTSALKIKELFTVYRAGGGHGNMASDGNYLKEILSKLEPDLGEQRILLSEISKRYGLTEKK